jgi:hypothetical protein
MPKYDPEIAVEIAIKQRFFGVAASAAYCDLSKKSIRRLLAAGKLTALRPVRGRVVIDQRELDSLILGSTKQPRDGRGFSR